MGHHFYLKEQISYGFLADIFSKMDRMILSLQGKPLIVLPLLKFELSNENYNFGKVRFAPTQREGHTLPVLNKTLECYGDIIHCVFSVCMSAFSRSV